MSKKIEATVVRDARSGRFTVREGGKDTKVSAASALTQRSVNQSISKNRDALKRLADR